MTRVRDEILAPVRDEGVVSEHVPTKIDPTAEPDPAEAPAAGAPDPAEAPAAGAPDPAEAPAAGAPDPAEAPAAGAPDPAEAPAAGVALPPGASGADVPSWVRAQLRCPDCRGELRDIEAALQCEVCARIHPVSGGIPVLIAGRSAAG